MSIAQLLFFWLKAQQRKRIAFPHARQLVFGKDNLAALMRFGIVCKRLIAKTKQSISLRHRGIGIEDNETQRDSPCSSYCNGRSYTRFTTWRRAGSLAWKLHVYRYDGSLTLGSTLVHPPKPKYQNSCFGVCERVSHCRSAPLTCTTMCERTRRLIVKSLLSIIHRERRTP